MSGAGTVPLRSSDLAVLGAVKLMNYYVRFVPEGGLAICDLRRHLS
jgi:hypothetical protein